MVLVEYGDYQCPYCGAAYPIVKNVQKELGTRLRFVFRNFPITTSHPQAEWAAETAEAAAVQGRFWEMHDFLYENQATLADHGFFANYAQKLKLDVKRLEQEVVQHVHGESSGRLHGWRQERCQRDADVLHWWREIRWLPRIWSLDRGARSGREGLTATRPIAG